MGFASGSVSFRRYAVVGEAPTSADQALLDKLAEHALKPGEFGAEEVEYGWGGGRHVRQGCGCRQPASVRLPFNSLLLNIASVSVRRTSYLVLRTSYLSCSQR